MRDPDEIATGWKFSLWELAAVKECAGGSGIGVVKAAFAMTLKPWMGGDELCECASLMRLPQAGFIILY
jgi:hypothetical protein